MTVRGRNMMHGDTVDTGGCIGHDGSGVGQALRLGANLNVEPADVRR